MRPEVISFAFGRLSALTLMAKVGAEFTVLASERFDTRGERCKPFLHDRSSRLLNNGSGGNRSGTRPVPELIGTAELRRFRIRFRFCEVDLPGSINHYATELPSGDPLTNRTLGNTEMARCIGD